MESLDKLKQSVQEVLVSGNGEPFAVFDFDDTCIVNDIGEAVFARICETRILKDDTLLPAGGGDYHERVFRHYYETLSERDGMLPAYLFCTEILLGFSPKEIHEIVSETIDAEGNILGKRDLYGIEIAKGLTVHNDVRDIMDFLVQNNVAIFIVSASPEETVREAMQKFEIPGTLIGLRNEIVDGKLTRNIQKPYSIAEGKVDCIKTYITPNTRPVLALGDSMNDFPMLEYALVRGVIDRGNTLAEEAQAREWFLL